MEILRRRSLFDNMLRDGRAEYVFINSSFTTYTTPPPPC